MNPDCPLHGRGELIALRELLREAFEAGAELGAAPDTHVSTDGPYPPTFEEWYARNVLGRY